MKCAISEFILPDKLVHGPELFIVGSWADIILAVVSSIMGVFVLSAAVQGFLLRKASIFERTILLVSSLLLIKPGWVTDIIGLFGFLLVLVWQFARGRKEEGKRVAPI